MTIEEKRVEEAGQLGADDSGNRNPGDRDVGNRDVVGLHDPHGCRTCVRRGGSRPKPF